MTTTETLEIVNVTESGRVAIVSTFHGVTNTNGNRMTVRRANGGGRRITVSWNYDVDTMTNHARAIQTFLELMNWGGQWRIGSTVTGAVAVWVGES
jgi:hypothetical protein